MECPSLEQTRFASYRSSKATGEFRGQPETQVADNDPLERVGGFLQPLTAAICVRSPVYVSLLQSTGLLFVGLWTALSVTRCLFLKQE